MNRFIRWYNQNREVFFVIIAVIAFIIIIIQALNSIAEQELEQGKNEIANNQNSSTNTGTTISETNVSVITGGTISNSTDQNNTSVIEQFVEYCNNGEIENAYNMLSDECKELIYPSIEDFTTNYYERIFYIHRMYGLETWYNYGGLCTYYIRYIEDVLASGDTNSSDNKGDYITVVEKDDGYYINISSYVGRKLINDVSTKNNVTIRVNWMDMYMDYTILNISAQNNTQDTICLDTKENIDTMYLYDENNVTYSSFLNEIAEEQLVIYKGMTNTLNIKFNKIYNPDREISGIALSDIVLNYDNYISNTEKKEKLIMVVE